MKKQKLESENLVMEPLKAELAAEYSRVLQNPESLRLTGTDIQITEELAAH